MSLHYVYPIDRNSSLTTLSSSLSGVNAFKAFTMLTAAFYTLPSIPFFTLRSNRSLTNLLPSKASQFCDSLSTVLDKHAPPSLRKAITHNSSRWFESIRDDLFMAKRKRRQAERKWRNIKLTIFKDLYRQAKHKFSRLVHADKCKFYTERIALASTSKELHQIVITLSNRHPPNILQTIYPNGKG